MTSIKYTDLPTIKGERVLLRPIAENDTDCIVRWRNLPAVRQFFLFREPFTHDMHRAWLNNRVKTGEVIQYIIVDRENGNDVGSAYFRDIDMKNESAEYGIFIGEISARGKGIGLETARLFTKFGFEDIGFHRIFLRVLGNNRVARRSYENAGFRVEGIFRDCVKLDGKFADVVFMSKLKGDE